MWTATRSVRSPALVAVVALWTLTCAACSMLEVSDDLGWAQLHTTKLRHSRHSESSRIYPGNHQKETSSRNLSIKDNHKPIFTNCSHYQPTLAEHVEAGTELLTVRAEDKDPPEHGGTLRYEFVTSSGEKNKFTIDPEKGIIKTLHVFDRDEPSREKEAYITVMVTDNGSPPLGDACTIRVTILDINDNYPSFDKASYTESVPQDLQVGKEVMRISATDIDDGNNSLVFYNLDNIYDSNYFRIDENSGVIYLNKTIDKVSGQQFSIKVTARDNGLISLTSPITLDIRVVEPNKKGPSFIDVPIEPIRLKENVSNYTVPIATLLAVSNIPEKELLFELSSGNTEQTNKGRTFLLVVKNDTAFIKQAGALDYERITDYILTVRVQNKFEMAAVTKVNIIVEDVNDNIPVFIETRSGSILENEPIGTPVMQVRAIDADGTSEHNQVTYELADHTELFQIDKYTGNITSLAEFDRESKDFYNVKVIATDNSPSALLSTGEHNSGQQVFRIEIADKNDNQPKFTKDIYVADAVAEDANINELVTQVVAEDVDTATQVIYSIVSGNTYDAFSIENTTGKIRVNNKLDYENITQYTLNIKAFDGSQHDFTEVKINIDNVNDNTPVFVKNYTETIVEEQEIPGCICKVEAYDPDIPDRNAPQKIVYSLVKEDQQKMFKIDNDGCLQLTRPLDRDPPNGYSVWQVLIAARDQLGSPTSLRSTTEVILNLTDINDNAPILSNSQPVIWYENRPPGRVVKLTAIDYDSERNGAPFTFQLNDNATNDIMSKFKIEPEGADTYLKTLDYFDREEIKEYFLPILITDSGVPPMSGVSMLHVIIGDENDNPMLPGHSEILVYNYMAEGPFTSEYLERWPYVYGSAPDTEIGRVYVTDPDDWDLPDKHFTWLPSHIEKSPYFDVSSDTGMITMTTGTPEGVYFLMFNVTEENLDKIPFHWVEATVNVTVKVIPEEAVNKSGSIRFLDTTAEEFITVQRGGLSKKDLLSQQLSLIFNTSLENVDLFTVYSHKNMSDSQVLDVRFSAHGSPYYAAEKLNSLASAKKDELESLLHLQIQMISIDECLVEKTVCSGSCRNKLNTSKVPLSVYTNKTSFVGISAIVEPECTCSPQKELVCFNGGTPFSDRCECPDGLSGPRCELTYIGFRGEGWAIYPSLPTCEDSSLSLEITPRTRNGLIFYVGPLIHNRLMEVEDFMSLELIDGTLVLLVNYGSGTMRIENKYKKIDDSKPHLIEITLMKAGVEMFVDRCRLSSCMNIGAIVGSNQYLNVNGPLQLGGANVNLKKLGQLYNWNHTPSDTPFVGCISNFTFNQETYNLGMPSDAKNIDPQCSVSTAKAVSFGIDTSFLIAILVCVAILLILLLAVVVHKRRSEGWAEKEFDDIRENIINYEDEGGGEGDAGYDLQVLRKMYDPPEKDNLQTYAPGGLGVDGMMPGDISGFLDDKKHVIDRDPDTNPFDDVRHYAYEGDGNTTGSLSSLASCTDEGDLKFNYISSFGPRFRKLADMYGEVPSDEDESQAPGEESWC